MRLLFFSWGTLNEDVLFNNLKKMGYDPVRYNTKCEDYLFDGRVSAELMELINKNEIDTVISFNYMPLVALVCDVCNILYYSWTYDCPQLSMFSKTVLYKCNRIGVFDKRLLEFYKGIGYNNVFYAPLATDSEFYAERIRGVGDRLNIFSDKGYADISFVGSLYTDKRKLNLYDIFKSDALASGIDCENWAVLDEIINEHCFNRFRDFMYEDIDNIIEFLSPYMLKHSMGLGDNYFEANEIIARESILEKKVTAEERKILMDAIGTYCTNVGKNFALYTTSDTSYSSVIDKYNRGPVDYDQVMPAVFNRSKININITLRSIHSGMPLRIFDILGCGGFLLSDAQEELLENFDEGVHMAVYSTPEECIEKADFYLKHEDLRQKIAKAGRDRVTELFSYEKGIKRLFSGC